MFIAADGDNGVDMELSNNMDHRVSSESVNRLIAEIDDEVSTSPLAWVLPIAESRAINAWRRRWFGLTLHDEA